MRLLSLIAVPCFLFLSSCKRENKNSTADHKDTTALADTGVRDGTLLIHDTLANGKPAERPRPPLEFDLKGFIQFGDSLVSVISGNETHFRYVISNRVDTTNASHKVLNSADVKKIQNYRLLPVKPGGEKWTIALLRVTYEKPAQADAALKQVRNLAITVKNFSKKNDYIFHSGSEVVWLQTGCAYNENNHEKLKNALLKNLRNNDPQGMINCGCGKGCK